MTAWAQGQLHSIDYMIVKDLAHTYPTATGREVQRAMVEGSPHLHERKAWHIDDYTRRTVRTAWERQVIEARFPAVIPGLLLEGWGVAYQSGVIARRHGAGGRKLGHGLQAQTIAGRLG